VTRAEGQKVRSWEVGKLRNWEAQNRPANPIKSDKLNKLDDLNDPNVLNAFNELNEPNDLSGVWERFSTAMNSVALPAKIVVNNHSPHSFFYCSNRPLQAARMPE
jgi:hypothetical protein